MYKWKYGIPASKIDDEFEFIAKDAEKIGLYFAGDYLLGKGRVMFSFNSGLIVGEKILAKL